MKTKIKIGASTMEIDTHPNAPVVVNFYTDNGKRNGKRYNTDPWRMKYSSEENAQWMADVMNMNNITSHWYIANV